MCFPAFDLQRPFVGKPLLLTSMKIHFPGDSYLGCGPTWPLVPETPRWPREAPSWPTEASRWPQEGPKTPQDDLEMVWKF